MKSWHIELNLSREELLKYYSGEARQVLAYAKDGKKIAFPAEILRQFMTHQGVHGTFKIRCDSQGKLHSIEKLES